MEYRHEVGDEGVIVEDTEVVAVTTHTEAEVEVEGEVTTRKTQV